VELTKPLDDLLFDKAFILLDAKGNISLDSGFGAKRHFPLTQVLSDIGHSLGNDFQNINGLAVYTKDSITASKSASTQQYLQP